MGTNLFVNTCVDVHVLGGDACVAILHDGTLRRPFPSVGVQRANSWSRFQVSEDRDRTVGRFTYPTKPLEQRMDVSDTIPSSPTARSSPDAEWSTASAAIPSSPRSPDGQSK